METQAWTGAAGARWKKKSPEHPTTGEDETWPRWRGTDTRNGVRYPWDTKEGNYRDNVAKSDAQKCVRPGQRPPPTRLGAKSDTQKCVRRGQQPLPTRPGAKSDVQKCVTALLKNITGVVSAIRIPVPWPVGHNGCIAQDVEAH